MRYLADIINSGDLFNLLGEPRAARVSEEATPATQRLIVRYHATLRQLRDLEDRVVEIYGSDWFRCEACGGLYHHTDHSGVAVGHGHCSACVPEGNFDGD